MGLIFSGTHSSVPATGTAARTTVGDPAGPQSRRYRGLIVVALVLTGLTMRVAVSSVGAVLTELQRGLHTFSALAGIITALPVIAFAFIGFVGPRLAHRFGEHGVVATALLVATVGLTARAFATGFWMFAVLSMLALTGGAITNVLMPTLVKRHFPNHIGAMTAVYTTCLAVGATAAAGLTVPIAKAAGDSWRFGIGSWSVLTAGAILPWLAALRGDRSDTDTQAARLPIGRLVRSRLAWALTLMFGFQSFQAYISFGWFADFFRHYHVSATEAGVLVAFFSGLSIPASMVIPPLAVRRQRALVIGLAVASLLSYIGMLTAPVAGAWLWMLLGGIGAGMFPLTLTMIGLHSRGLAVTASLSAFVQSIGYILAASGPIVVGVLLGVSDTWTWPLTILLIALAISTAGGLYASRPGYVDDQLQGNGPRRSCGGVRRDHRVVRVGARHPRRAPEELP